MSRKWGELVASFECILFPEVKWWQFWKPYSMAISGNEWGNSYTFFYKWGFKTTIVQPKLKIHWKTRFTEKE